MSAAVGERPRTRKVSAFLGERRPAQGTGFTTLVEADSYGGLMGRLLDSEVLRLIRRPCAVILDEVLMNTSGNPFRDDLAAAIRRAEFLARENANLRVKLAIRHFDAFRGVLVAILVVCGIAEAYLLSMTVSG